MATDVSTSAAAQDEAHNAAWMKVKKRLRIGQILLGVVQEVRPFGVFIDLGESVSGFLDILECPDTGLQVGEPVEVRIVQFADWNKQVRVVLTNGKAAETR